MENEVGGKDFVEWELLEISIVPIPANQNALRLAVKALDESEPEPATNDVPPSPKQDDEIDEASLVLMLGTFLETVSGVFADQ
jgi:hypothetical protein